MRPAVATWMGWDAVQELRQREDGAYYMVTYVHDADMDRDVTRREAGEWVDMARKHGGTVHREMVKR